MDACDAVHPTDQTLQQYGLGKLNDNLFQKVSQHLEACPPCQSRVSELSSDSFLGRLRQARSPAEEPVAAPPKSGGASKQPEATATSGSSDPRSTLPAELVDNPDYQIIRELGRGGMGVVYLAHNRLMGRHEAIKVIGRQLMERPIVLDRFLREIRSVARLRHPNVVAAYSATRMGESIVYAMEYVDGLDLARLVKSKGPLPVIQACYFTHQVALGLQHAHEHGIVHRDIKPGNLILSRDGERPIVKILDFGLNKAASEDGIDGALTHQGQMLGTPDYIAPEQTIDAQSVDIRADIYSLGCTLYYLLSGGPPFRASSLYEVLKAHHSTEARPLNLVRPEVPAELAGVVAKMMAKELEQRFQKPAEVAQALAPFTKKSNGASGAPKPEISRSVQAGPKRHSSSASSAPDPPDTNIPSSRGTPLKPAEVATQSDSSWGNLIELREPASLTAAHRPPDRLAALIRWRLPSAFAGVAVMGLVAAWGTGLFSSKPKNSETINRPSVGSPSLPKEHTASADAPLIAPSKQPEPPNRMHRQSTAPTVVANKDPLRLAPTSDKPDDGIAVIPPKPVEPAFTPEKAVIKAVGKKEPVDIRRIARRPGVLNLTEAGAILPILEFWPLLTPENLTAWQVADPSSIKMNEDGVLLDAGEYGNFLITQRTDFKRCKVLATISAAEGTEAYVALRAHIGPDGWRAVTSRLDERSRKIRGGTQALDFHVTGKGKVRDDFVPGKFFNVEFKINESSSSRVLINGKETAKENRSGTRAEGYVGAAGLFVKSGRVIIKALRISDSD